MLVAALLISALSLATARVYERCELARDLVKLGVSRDDVATWVCIAFHESRFDTAARNPFSGDHGLLQISELYWCGPGKACGAPCSAFRDEDISDDVRCALQIHEEHTRLQGNGFLAWVVYPQHCKHNAKKYLVDCEATKSVSKSNEARSLKIFEKNITSQPQLTYNYVESNKPNFLAISDLFKAHIARDFEQNYYENKKQPNWLNVKIDNVNDVKTPVVGRNLLIEFTTPRTVATTIDPTLKGVKPPSPRKIETNQFRRRMLNFDVPVKYDYILNEQTKTTKASSIDNDFFSHNIFINRARALSNFNLNYIENNTHKPTTTVEVKTTKINVSTQKQTPTTTTVPTHISTRRGKTKFITNLSNFDEQSYIQRTKTVPSSNFADSSRQINRINITQDIIEISPTQDIIQINEPKTATNENISILAKKLSTTEKNEITTKTQSTSAPKLSRSSSRFFWNSQTTARPRLTWNTVSSSLYSQRSSTENPIILTRAPTPALATTTSTSLSTSTAYFSTEKTSIQLSSAKPTQSIFDLYLNPTRATIRPFQFATFKNSPFKLRIFSGGTTTSPPSFIRKTR